MSILGMWEWACHIEPVRWILEGGEGGGGGEGGERERERGHGDTLKVS